MEDLLLQLRSLAGLFVFAGLAWVLGPRRKFPVVFTLAAIVLQISIAWPNFRNLTPFDPTKSKYRNGNWEFERQPQLP